MAKDSHGLASQASRPGPALVEEETDEVPYRYHEEVREDGVEGDNRLEHVPREGNNGHEYPTPIQGRPRSTRAPIGYQDYELYRVQGMVGVEGSKPLEDTSEG